jgi:hypothetical protein
MTVGAASQGSNQLRNSEFFKIHIKHIPTDQRVSFEGFVTQFSDTYTAQWNEEQVYGRMDPLATYQGTKRNITLGFDIPADSKQMAIYNMQMIQKLIQFMYPVYESGDLTVQNVLQAAPLLTLKWTNLVSSVNNEGQELVGYINGPISYAPDVSDGGFMDSEVTRWSLDAQGRKFTGKQLESKPHTEAIKNYFPKRISMNFNFTVLHTHLVGWAPGKPIAGWGDMSEDAIATAKKFGGKPKTMTATYVFGNTEVNERFPNIYKAFPPPEPQSLSPEREAELNAEYDEAQQTIANAETSLQDREQAHFDLESSTRWTGASADVEAASREVLGDLSRRANAPTGVETFTTESGLVGVRRRED